jgi:hypothetical protein
LSQFEQRLMALATAAELKVAELHSSVANLRFEANGSIQTVWVKGFSGGLWEISCLSFAAVDNVDDLPKAILAMVLERNATKRRGFWCIEKLSEKYVLEYMHNIPEFLLTPNEFESICRSMVREADELETALRKWVRG